MDKSFRLVRGPFVVVARSTAIDGPRTGLRHVSLPRHQFYFYSPFFCFLLCLCPLAPSPRTMVWIILAPLASSPLGFGLFFTSFDPLLPAADASVSLPFRFLDSPFNPSLLHRDVLPFHGTRVGNPPLEVSVTNSIDETDPLVRRQPSRRTKRCASTRVCDRSAHGWKARKHVRGREADLGDADAAQAPSRTEDKHARQCQSAAEDRPTCLTGAHAIHVVHVGDDDEVRKRGC